LTLPESPNHGKNRDDIFVKILLARRRIEFKLICTNVFGLALSGSLSDVILEVVEVNFLDVKCADRFDTDAMFDHQAGDSFAVE